MVFRRCCPMMSGSFLCRIGAVLFAVVVVSLCVQYVRVMSSAQYRQTSDPQVVYPVGESAKATLPVTPAPPLNPETRAERLKYQCETSEKMPDLKQPDVRHRLLIFKPLNVTLCYVPKAGCTFWKRVFISLRSPQVGTTKDVFALKKDQAHGGSIDKLSGIKDAEESYTYLTNSHRFIFIRDPYARLWSAYIDKFYLSDFWGHGVSLIKKIRTDDDRFTTCGHDLSFAEYLQMVNNRKLSSGVGPGEEHWLPISGMCNPCLFNYKFVGTAETFDDDRTFILNKLGLNKYVKTNISRDDTAIDTITQQILTYWKRPVERCLPKIKFIERLYESFKMQGYIPLERKLRTHLIDINSQEKFTDLVLREYNENKVSLDDWNQRRRKAMVAAYASVPMALKLSLLDTFKYDFLLFGYDPKPTDIFTPETTTPTT